MSFPGMQVDCGLYLPDRLTLGEIREGERLRFRFRKDWTVHFRRGRFDGEEVELLLHHRVQPGPLAVLGSRL
jgi:hypothetical protein